MSKVDNEAEYLMTLLGIDPSRTSLTLGRRTGTRIRILHGSTSSTAAQAPKPTSERRREPRLTPDQTRWAEAARLRPGVDVRVLDIGSRGVLIEAAQRLHIGVRVELTLFATDANTRLELMGVVRRCHVSSLSPITYRGALEFNQAIEVQALQPFLSTAALSA
jgi:hypothetical protein